MSARRPYARNRTNVEKSANCSSTAFRTGSNKSWVIVPASIRRFSSSSSSGAAPTRYSAPGPTNWSKTPLACRTKSSSSSESDDAMFARFSKPATASRQYLRRVSTPLAAAAASPRRGGVAAASAWQHRGGVAAASRRRRGVPLRVVLGRTRDAAARASSTRNSAWQNASSTARSRRSPAICSNTTKRVSSSPHSSSSLSLSNDRRIACAGRCACVRSRRSTEIDGLRVICEMTPPMARPGRAAGREQLDGSRPGAAARPPRGRARRWVGDSGQPSERFVFAVDAARPPRLRRPATAAKRQVRAAAF